jgi:hypothetical protein
MAKREGRHWVDGRWMTTREVAARVGVSVNALLMQKHNQGVSMPALVRMYDSGLIDAGRSRGQKYMVRGRWTTIGEEAARLGVTWRAINKWMHNHGQGGKRRRFPTPCATTRPCATGAKSDSRAVWRKVTG